MFPEENRSDGFYTYDYELLLQFTESNFLYQEAGFNMKMDYTKTMEGCVVYVQDNKFVEPDFCDDWTINLILEKANFETDLSSSKLPNVLEGKGLGIIENCGGVYGLENLRNVFQKKSGEEYEELSTWLGTKELDLDFFDIKRCNAIIKSKMKIFEENYWE